MNQRLRGINLGQTVVGRTLQRDSTQPNIRDDDHVKVNSHRRSSRTGAGDPADNLLLSHARGRTGRERVSGGNWTVASGNQGKATRVFGEAYWESKPLIAAGSLRWLDGAAIAVQWADLCERTGQRPATLLVYDNLLADLRSI
ncbi:hypothetical protein VP01_457g16 [Puccinia sorghi]|uniref:Uncharacterized protein n=1 Tax=Puccinia sorghi TaxID=27349 RepID=A0A0L6UPG1_9BASI|nr:hypothetical protein VP01_457g16 [Puccinia sorghi]